MKKRTIVNDIAIKQNLPIKKVATVIDTTLDTIAEALKEGESVAIYGFGSFVLEKRKERTLYLPGSKDKVLIQEKLVIKFRPSKKLKDEVAYSEYDKT